jgi:hypothetical protein
VRPTPKSWLQNEKTIVSNSRNNMVENKNIELFLMEI